MNNINFDIDVVEFFANHEIGVSVFTHDILTIKYVPKCWGIYKNNQAKYDEIDFVNDVM